MGSRLGQRASECACLVGPPLFRADSGTNLFKQGEISKVGHWLNNSVVSRIARGPGFESRSGHDFFLPCDILPLHIEFVLEFSGVQESLEMRLKEF